MLKVGGSYKIVDGVKVLVNRTGWTPPKKDSGKPEKSKRGRKPAGSKSESKG